MAQIVAIGGEAAKAGLGNPEAQAALDEIRSKILMAGPSAPAFPADGSTPHTPPQPPPAPVIDWRNGLSGNTHAFQPPVAAPLEGHWAQLVQLQHQMIDRLEKEVAYLRSLLRPEPVPRRTRRPRKKV